MYEEDAVENVTPKKIEKKIKSKSKKREKNEDTVTETQVAQNISDAEGIEHVQMKRDEKKLKKKKRKEGKVAEADIKKGSSEGELTVVCGEDGNGDAMVNVEKKRKKREKNKKRDDKLDGESLFEMKSIEDANKEREKQKLKRKREDGNFEDGEKEFGQHSQDCEVHPTEMVEKKKRKKEKKKNKDDNGYQDVCRESNHEGDLPLMQQENVAVDVEGNTESTNHDGDATKEHKKKKKKKKKTKNKTKKHNNVDCDKSGLMYTDEMQSNEVEYEKQGKTKETKSVGGNGSNDATPNKSSKKVRFSGQVEIFPLPGDSKENSEEDNLVRGKRFTPEEDAIVKESLLSYIDKRNLGSEGLDMVLNSKKHRELRGCWKEIAAAIPYRPYISIYYRAQVLFGRSESRKWTKEEYEEVLKYQEEHGNEWKALAEELGKHRVHVKDTWRRIKLSNRKKGHWSQEEYQQLFELVNVDLQAKVSEEKRSKHGMLRDNICWTAISDEMATRTQANCCIKWYKQLTSSMVTEGVWADTDDYRLINALHSLDATCMEDVDWDCLVEDRTGDVCRKRWNQMVLHIGRHGHESFAEQVELLAQRYCPNLLEARETWDNKPRVP